MPAKGRAWIVEGAAGGVVGWTRARRSVWGSQEACAGWRTLLVNWGRREIRAQAREGRPRCCNGLRADLVVGEAWGVGDAKTGVRSVFTVQSGSCRGRGRGQLEEQWPRRECLWQLSLIQFCEIQQPCIGQQAAADQRHEPADGTAQPRTACGEWWYDDSREMKW